MNAVKLTANLLSAVSVLVACSTPSNESKELNSTQSSEAVILLPPDLELGGEAPESSANFFEECAGQVASTEALPVNALILFDTSCSMGCPPELSGPGQCCSGNPDARIDPVRNAVGDFLQAPDTAGMRAGIAYFGNQPVGFTSCNAGDYAQPAVSLEWLPDNAGAIIASLDAQLPLGETPTGPAIRGACEYSLEWRQANPGNAMALILVTDGVPEAPTTLTCNPSIQDAAEAARACRAEGIPTYVIGVGKSLENLNQLAAAGGTNAAHLVQNTANVAGEVLAALSAIRESAILPCEFSIPTPPDGAELDPRRVNVTYTAGDGVRELIPSVLAPDGCSAGGGWYYDEPDDPSAVVLCESSCNQVTAGLTASSARGTADRIELQFGCQTVTTLR